MIRCYIKPFNDTGEYVTNWSEVTDYIDIGKIGTLKQELDNNEYDVGIFGYNSLSITLENESGIFSDIDATQSMFKYKRANSLFKITWSLNPHPLQCGLFVCGEGVLNDEIDLFTGLINDDSASSNINDQKIKFKILGKESIFSQEIVPYSDLSVGDLFSEALLTILDQTVITNVLTVSSGNISTGVDVTLDVITNFENQTVKEALDDLLEKSNSILYVKDDTIYIEPRTVHSALSYTFYGQAATDGIEDIQNIKNIKSGINKTFNFWTWKDTTLTSSNADSVLKNGYKKKEIDFDSITNTTKRQSILDSNKDEFGSPKQEFDLTAIMDYDTIDLFILDKVSVDYPTVLYAADENSLPIFGVAIFGEARFPYGEWSLIVDASTEFKILSRNLDTKSSLITFKLKEV